MEGVEVLDFGRDALWTTVIMCAPAMIAGLVVGLAIAFFQALTQVQEMTLVFVPKMAAMFIGGVLLLPFMLATLSDFMERLASMIVGID